MTDAGYEYDAFGRTVRMPSGLTNTFHVNDLVQRQQFGDARARRGCWTRRSVSAPSPPRR
ncbi:hypothetical protein [Micromonospora sp. NPDC002717]|uniref:hypothetical protein n=1 Tax=Micromonospora sp. NPDC002717 TaxID=3154424 RepID=UPI003331E9F5